MQPTCLLRDLHKYLEPVNMCTLHLKLILSNHAPYLQILNSLALCLELTRKEP